MTKFGTQMIWISMMPTIKTKMKKENKRLKTDRVAKDKIHSLLIKNKNTNNNNNAPRHQTL